MSESRNSNDTTLEEAIRELNREIERYEEIARDVKGALADTERELEQLLADNYGDLAWEDEAPDTISES